jgi:multidrug efflux pump subunit AcrB
MTMVACVLLVVGALAFRSLPSQLTPDVEYPRLTINVGWQSAPAEAVESTITAPLEGELSKLMGLKTLSSVSSEGRARLTIEFHPHVNMDMARLEINERLSNLMETLPRDVTPPQVSNYVPEEVEKMQGFLTYTLSANRHAGEVRRYAEEYLQLPLRSVKGVSSVEIQGGSQRCISIELNRTRMEQLQLRPDEVTSALQDVFLTISGSRTIRANASATRNSAEPPKLAHAVVVQSLKTIEDLKQLPLALRSVQREPTDRQVGNQATNESSIIRLGEVATIRDDYEAPRSFYRLNGKETVVVRLYKEQGADIISTADRVYETIERLRAALPHGYTLTKESDTSEAMRLELNEFFSTLIYATSAAMLIVLVAFHRTSALTIALIVFLSVVCTLALSFLGFAVSGLGLNIITIAALVLGFGITVDNTVIMAEFLERTIRGSVHLPTSSSTRMYRFGIAARLIAIPLVGSALTTLAVIVPLLFLESELRAYLADFALASAIIVSASVLVSLTFVPLLCWRWLRVKPHTKPHLQPHTRPTVAFALYSRILQAVERFRKTAVLVFLLLVGIPIWMLPSRIETPDVPLLAQAYNAVFDSPQYAYFKPYIQNALGGAWNIYANRLPRGEMWQFGSGEYLSIYLKLPHGNRIERINALARDIEREVLRYASSVKLLSTSVLDEETALLRVEFPRELADRSFPYKLKNYLTAYATRLGGLEVSVYGFGEAFSTGFGAAPVSFVVTVRGFNYDEVKALAQEFKRVIERNPRVAQVDIDRSSSWGDPETFEQALLFDRQRLQQTGITIEQILPFVRMNAIGTLSGSTFRLDNEEVRYDIKYADYRERQASELLEQSVIDAYGAHNKLSSVVALAERKVQARIYRENRQYIRLITFEFQGPYRYGEEFLKQSLATIPLKAGYSLEGSGGGFRFDDEQELSLGLSLLLSIGLIIMIVAALFESLRAPSAMLLIIPVALMGAVYSLWLFGLSLDRGAYAGILLLIALSVNIALVMLYIIRQQSSLIHSNTISWLAYQRLRPILITCCTTVCAMLPLLLQGHYTFWKTFAATVIGGIVWTSIVLPLMIPSAVVSIMPVRQIQNHESTTALQ